MYATFNGFEIKMTLEQARDCSHSGACDADVAELLELPVIRRQLNNIGPEAIASELSEYGAWDDEELTDHEENKALIVWIAAGNISEEHPRNP